MTEIATETHLSLIDIHKIYQMGESEVRALNGIDLDFPRGSFVAIMGKSGSGKSTMLNVLGCLDRPTSGQYLLQGQDVSKLNDDDLSRCRLRYLGFIFQSFNLIPQLTVRENIELPLFYRDMEAQDSGERAAELAQQVGIADRLDHRPAELSGGQQQRVAIARALANKPEVLLADEPTGNLDSATSAQILTLLEELNDQGRTIVMVTHERDIAARASRRITMEDGKVSRDEGSAS